MSKKVPGFSSKITSEGSDQEDAFVLLFAPNYSNASCRLGYSLIYYNTKNCTYSAQDRQNFYNATKNEIILVGAVSPWCDAIALITTSCS